MDSYPITRKLANGATVADWLGTAKVAAEVGAMLLERVRTNASTMPAATLERAEKEFIQAIEELRFVREQVEGRQVRCAGTTRITHERTDTET